MWVCLRLFPEGFDFENIRFQNVQFKDFSLDKSFVLYLPIYSIKNSTDLQRSKPQV